MTKKYKPKSFIKRSLKNKKPPYLIMLQLSTWPSMVSRVYKLDSKDLSFKVFMYLVHSIPSWLVKFVFSAKATKIN